MDYRYKYSLFHPQIRGKITKIGWKQAKIIRFCTHLAPLSYRYFYDPLIDIDISQRLPIDIDIFQNCLINIDIFQNCLYRYRYRYFQKSISIFFRIALSISIFSILPLSLSIFSKMTISISIYRQSIFNIDISNRATTRLIGLESESLIF